MLSTRRGEKLWFGWPPLGGFATGHYVQLLDLSILYPPADEATASAAQAYVDAADAGAEAEAKARVGWHYAAPLEWSGVLHVARGRRAAARVARALLDLRGRQVGRLVVGAHRAGRRVHAAHEGLALCRRAGRRAVPAAQPHRYIFSAFTASFSTLTDAILGRTFTLP